MFIIKQGMPVKKTEKKITKKTTSKSREAEKIDRVIKELTQESKVEEIEAPEVTSEKTKEEELNVDSDASENAGEENAIEQSEESDKGEGETTEEAKEESDDKESEVVNEPKEGEQEVRSQSEAVTPADWLNIAPEKQVKKNLLMPFILTLIVTILISGAFFAYQVSTESSSKQVVVSPTPVPTVTAVPDKIDVSEYEVEVLNGSGISGEAGRAKTILENGEFVVDSTGNADSYDFEETVISVNGDVPEEVITQLKEVLSEEYAVSDEIEEDEEQETAIVITVGSGKSE